jgi:hypothetical protein
MLSFGKFIALFITFSILSQSLGDTQKPSLVVNVFRHGARGPKDKDFDPNWDPSLYSQLTPVGQRMQYLLGAGLAKKYPHILGKSFDRHKVYVRSSESTRCVESALAQVYGAYDGTGPSLDSKYPTERAVPPYDSQIIQDLIKDLPTSQAMKRGVVPIVINSVPVKEDMVLETPGTCPASYLDLRKTVLSKKFFNFWYETFAPTKDALKAKGFKVSNPFDLQGLVDTLDCNYAENRKAPGDLDYNSQLVHNVTMGGVWMFISAVYSSPFQKSMLSVPLFDEVFRHLDAKAEKKTGVEFVFLSTHDTALLTILTALNIVNEDCLYDNFLSKAGQPLPHPECIFPPFAANILFEFYDNNGKPYVILKYNDAAIPLCNGKVECPYQDFKALVKKATNNYTVKDYQKECFNGAVEDIKFIIEEIKRIFGKFR